MKGLIVGDVVGSPYRKYNITHMNFVPYETNQVELHTGLSRARGDRAERSFDYRNVSSSRLEPSQMTGNSVLACAVAKWVDEGSHALGFARSRDIVRGALAAEGHEMSDLVYDRFVNAFIDAAVEAGSLERNAPFVEREGAVQEIVYPRSILDAALTSVYGKEVIFEGSYGDIIGHILVGVQREYDKRDLKERLISFCRDVKDSEGYVHFSKTMLAWLDNEGTSRVKAEGAGIARVLPLMQYGRGEADVLDLVDVVLDVTHAGPAEKDVCKAVVLAGWLSNNGQPRSVILRRLAEMGYDMEREHSELMVRMSAVRSNPEGFFINGKYYETQEPNTDCAQSAIAGLCAFFHPGNGSLKDVICRAVSYGGESSTVAAVAGALAETKFAVPYELSFPLEERIPGAMQDIMRHYDKRYVDIRKRPEKVEVKKVVEEEPQVLEQEMPVEEERKERAPGHAVQYIGALKTFYVPESREDLREDIRRIKGEDVIIKNVSCLQEDYEKVCRDLQGERTGTYAVTWRLPEIRTLYVYDGVIASVYGTKCPEIEQNRNGFDSRKRKWVNDVFRFGYKDKAGIRHKGVREVAIEVRDALQRSVGYDGESPIHFKTAFYPVIYEDRIEVRQGDFLVGVLGIDTSTGRLFVDRSSENPLGELKDAEWCAERVFDNVNPYDSESVRQALERFCLDAEDAVQHNWRYEMSSSEAKAIAGEEAGVTSRVESVTHMGRGKRNVVTEYTSYKEKSDSFFKDFDTMDAVDQRPVYESDEEKYKVDKNNVERANEDIRYTTDKALIEYYGFDTEVQETLDDRRELSPGQRR